MERLSKPGSAPRRSVGAGRQSGSVRRRSSVGIGELLDSIPGAWFFTRRDGSFAYVSLGACEALGYSRQQLLAATVFDIDPTLTPETWPAHWNGTKPGEPRTARTVHRRKDGTEYPVELRSVKLELDGEQLSGSYTVDMTVSEQTRAALLATESRLSRLLERLPEGVARDVTQSHNAELQSRRLLAAIEQAAEAVVVTDAVGVVEYVNPAYRLTTGITERDALGKPWRELEVRKDHAFLRRLAAALGKGELWQGRIQSVRTNGLRFDEDATLAPIRDDLGQQVGCVAVKRDITEQLALEEQLHQAQKLEAVGQLAGGIAHDFNNLLHVIQGHTHMMQELDLEGFSRANELREMLGEVNKASERAATLVRQLLAFSRKGGAELSKIRLDELLASLHGLLQRLLGEQNQLMLTCNAGAVTILGNRSQLEQMVTNLCINARDAMRPAGYLHIGLEATAHRDLPPLFRGRLEQPYVRITVRDDGAGMTRDVQRRLYEPFFTTKQPGEGVGLGLATVYAIVQSHLGFIDSTSTRGKGTTFNVYLPRADGAEHAEWRGSSRERVEGRGRLALVAEDEPAVLQLTSCYLRQAGFEVILATNGPEAERLLDERGSEIALAVLDAVMPGFGGQGVHQAMKDRNLLAPVIFVTGYDYETLAGAASGERVALLQKPFGQSEMLDQIARVLGEPA